MAKVIINTERCKGCLLCVGVCPKAMIEADNNLNKKGVKPAKSKSGDDCIGCMMCAVICPDCCIEIYK